MRPGGGYFRRVAQFLGPLGLFVIFAFCAVGHAPSHLGAAVPLGRNTPATVPVFNVWTIGWNADRASHGFRDYWDAPIFFPTRRAFAFSEAQPLTALLAPLVWWCKAPAAAYNFFLVGSLALNGLMTFRLARRLGIRWPGAAAGGALMVMLPFVQGQIEVLQLIPVWGILGTLTALIDHARQPRTRSGVLAGCWFGVTYLMCNYYGLFFSVLLIPACLVLFGRALLRREIWRTSVAGVVLALVIVAPVALEQLRVSHDYHWTRDRAEVDSLSAVARDFTAPASTRLPWLGLSRLAGIDPDDTRRLGLGTITLVLAIVGLVAGMAEARRRRWTVCAALVLVLSLFLAAGPRLAPLGLSPFEWLQSCYPGFGAIRSPFRFAVFSHMMVTLLSAEGVGAIYSFVLLAALRRSRRQGTTDSSEGERLTRRGRLGRLQAAALAPALCVALVALYEIWPSPAPLFTLPTREQHAGWVGWLREHTPPGLPIAYLPPPADLKVRSFEEMSLQMYYGLWHERRMILGYSGFFPPSCPAQHMALFEFPSPVCLDTLARQGVIIYVVRRSAYPWPLPAPEHLKLLFEDKSAGFDIYEFDIGAVLQNSGRGEVPGK